MALWGPPVPEEAKGFVFCLPDRLTLRGRRDWPLKVWYIVAGDYEDARGYSDIYSGHSRSLTEARGR